MDKEKIKGLIIKKIEDKTIILNPNNGNYYSLNKDARLIWDIARKNNREKTIAILKQKLNLDKKQLKEIDNTIDSLEKEDLLI